MREKSKIIKIIPNSHQTDNQSIIQMGRRKIAIKCIKDLKLRQVILPPFVPSSITSS